MSASFLTAVAVRAADSAAGADLLADAFAVFDISDNGTAPLPPSPSSPPHDPGLERFSALIRDAPPQSIIVLVGAGASVSAGIPDFRTPGTGLYDNLHKVRFRPSNWGRWHYHGYSHCLHSTAECQAPVCTQFNLPYAEAVFDIDYFKTNPSPFYTLCKEMWPGRFLPTPAHRFFTALHEHGKLLRCYTQNIDSLESEAGLPDEMIVAAHGNFSRAHVVPLNERVSAEGSVCPEGRREVDIAEVKAAVEEGEPGWRRLNSRYGGLVKPAITFFGEDLPKRFVQCVKADFSRCSLCLIFGTSLMVQPFASLVRCPRPGTPRLLVNRERRGEDMGLDFDSVGTTDGLFLGDCDEGARGLAAHLGWTLSGDAHSAPPPDRPPPRVRLGLVRSESTRSAECAVLVSPVYDEIVRAAANKLKLKPRSVRRLVLRTAVAGYPAGTELPTAGDCSSYLKNDAILWVKVGATEEEA
jgi:NAD-dependent SIR2 family protein deacetylase